MRVVSAALGLIFLNAPLAASEWRASPWVRLQGAQVRLIAPPLTGAATEAGGIEVRLAPGSKTYWRTPGETGVPPLADFSTSSGVEPPLLGFPAPTAFDDGAGGIAWGYTEQVIFPVALKRAGSGAPVVGVRFSFGICQKNLCLPAEADLRLGPGDGQPDPGLSATMAEARARVPVPTPLKAADRPAIDSAALRRDGASLVVEISARVAPGSAAPSLFVEGEDSFAVETREAGGDGRARFVARTSSNRAGPITLKLTLVSGETAIETDVTLDAR
jgi:DsbC/DsbD-like thiol-disulfide interchange protein